ncbi:MAG: DEAD/DEAH box helicase [Clostridiales bacterium]|nr:DEAD/DEAH box helicase [Clostridiales bacterium]
MAIEYSMRLSLRRDTNARAQRLISDGALSAVTGEGDDYTATVTDEYNKSYPRITVKGGKITGAFCTCRFSYEDSEHLCCHAAALALYLRSPERMAQKREELRRERAQALLSAFEGENVRKQSINLQVTINVSDGHASVSAKAGGERMYVIKNINEFYSQYVRGDEIRLGKSYIIDSHFQAFDQSDENILRIMDEAALTSSATIDKKAVPLNDYQLKRLLRTLHDRPYLIAVGQMRPSEQTGILNALPEMRFELKRSDGDRGGFVLSAFTDAPSVPLCADGEFVYCNDIVYHMPRHLRHVSKMLMTGNARTNWYFDEEDAAGLISDVLPALETASQLTVSRDILDAIVTLPLSIRVDLDILGHDVAAQITFEYGDIRINPVTGVETPHEGILRRDRRKERHLMDFLAEFGFEASDGAMLIRKPDDIYRFLDRGVSQLNRFAHVYATQALLQIRPRTVPMRGNIKVGGTGVQFSLMLGGIEADNMPEILLALREKRKFVRLTDGSFITLQARPHWDDLAREVLDNGKAVGDHIELEAYRTVYLNSLLDSTSLEVTRDTASRAIAELKAGEEEVEPTIPGLRSYQKRGFNWLRQLYQMNLGGILADDMGLGKTVQMLSVIKYAREKDGFMTSLVVAPTSLVYNWEREIQKFAPDLSVCVLEGSGEARQKQIEACEEFDVLISSYAQLRRDIDELEKHKFRFCVLDEAQNIKNFRSVAATAVKRVNAQARFALTGTPMENHVGELWSVFDFILPGYLGSHAYFATRFGDGSHNEELAVKIRPFLMRRLKKDVLEELPDKMEYRVLVELDEYQLKVYRAMLQKYKAEIIEPSLGVGGFSRNRMRILAAITRLRQLCCHPSLFLEGYQGGSGKVEALLDIVQQCVRENRKVLVFSQFTAMLSILRDILLENGVKAMYLDGDIPARERAELCEKFNTDDTPVFLISLKAGGTGLNLTGADTVVHFDPWWNPAVEDQATDRAHRIGQTKKVQVIRLIARGTIEEKVADLQAHKKDLIDAVIKPGEVLPSTLTEAEIVELFD